MLDNMQYCTVSSSSHCEGRSCHRNIRGSGSLPAECSIVSFLLNRQREAREVQPLLWPHCKIAEESEKQKKQRTPDDSIIIH